LRKSGFPEIRIVQALKQAERGHPAREVCREVGIAEATCYIWKAKCGGMAAADLRRLMDLEEENARLERT
jgi:putative transposase